LCCNPSLVLWPKQGLARLWAKRGSLGVKKNVREWTFTLPRELPPWELESRWILECSENDCRGQNPIDWRVFYTIGKKCRCPKWACMTRLGIWNISYGQKKGRKSNWQFDSWSSKVRNQLDFLTCKWRATHNWKAFDEGYNFALAFISIQGLHAKVMGPQNHKTSNFGNFETPIWESQDNMSFGCGPRGKVQSIL